MVPSSRIRILRSASVEPRGNHVLYWMTAARRTRSNFGLERALELCHELGKPLVVLEALRCDYPWASERLHAFVLAGMADNAKAFARSKALYYPYVEPTPGAGKGLLEALALNACALVADDSPCFFLPHMLAAAASRIPLHMEAVDANGLLPIASSERVFTSAFSFRAFLQKQIAAELERFPAEEPLRGAEFRAPPELAAAIGVRWPRASAELLAAQPRALAALPIDHDVKPVATKGGARAGAKELELFIEERLVRYAEDRNEPGLGASSRLSPYLHFGHLAAHDVFRSVAAKERWSQDDLGARTGGRREGFWGMGASAESFLDQIVTWRELGYHFCARVPDHGAYESLPAWARSTLDLHASDPREHIYTERQLASAATHDPLWNAAQRQLLREGTIHNYMRMLWGKKVLEWTRSPREALRILIELNNRYALDGRDPNSYSGILWCLGRFDRPWGPERQIFGTVRFMSSANTARKLDVKGYLARYGERETS